MPTKQAKTLSADEFERLLAFATQRSKLPERDRLKLLLSFRAGLRPCEIARMRVKDMTDASGRPARDITIFVGKFGKYRVVPMHPQIRTALLAFQKAHPKASFVAISSRRKLGRPVPMSANAVTQWFWHLYRAAGLKGASGHSGRRTFGTELANRHWEFKRTLVDVQLLLGHARLDTTARYIQPNSCVTEMVNSL